MRANSTANPCAFRYLEPISTARIQRATAATKLPLVTIFSSLMFLGFMFTLALVVFIMEKMSKGGGGEGKATKAIKIDQQIRIGGLAINNFVIPEEEKEDDYGYYHSKLNGYIW